METSTQNTNKRLRNDSDTDTGTESQQLSFPRFLVIESIEPDKQISKLSPFVIEKQIESLAGIPKTVKKLRNGNLLVEVDKPQHAKNLLKINKFYFIKCKCYPHTSLNTSKGVIRCPDLAGVSDKEIADELKPQQVTEAKRIKMKRDNKLFETNTIILTFGTSILPRTIKVGYLVTKVEVYIPNPLQCFNCFKFGHGASKCTADEVCPNCSGDGIQHNEKDCKYPVKCINCNGEHSARSKHCPVWKEEKEVLQVKYTQNLAFPEARRIVKARHAPPPATYSSVTKTATVRSVQCVDAQIQTDILAKNIPDISVQQTSNNSSKSNEPSTKVTQNIPHYETTNKSNSTNKQQSRRVSQTPKQKIDITTDRVKKGSKDPIQNHNRYAALSDEEEMEDDVDLVPDGPPPLSATAKGGKLITRISPPNS